LQPCAPLEQKSATTHTQASVGNVNIDLSVNVFREAARSSGRGR
jgi:hypothetical protein